MLLDLDSRARVVRPNGGPSHWRMPATAALLAALAGYGFWGLTLPKGELRVTSDPTGATVIIDNWFQSKTPASHILPFGRHDVRVHGEGLEQQEFRVLVRQEPILIEARLRPLRASRFGVGNQ